MSKETLPVPAEVPKVKARSGGGMTIDEIRYRRALLALKKDFCKEKVINHKQKILSSSPFSKGYKAPKGTVMGRTGAIVAKLAGGLNYLDYVMMGVSAFQTGRKIFNVFRRK